MNHVRLALLRANLPADNYAGHSFRIGATTTAASSGIEDSTIQTLGRWQSSCLCGWWFNSLSSLYILLTLQIEMLVL